MSLRVFFGAAIAESKKVSRSLDYFDINRYMRLLDTSFPFAIATENATRSDNGHLLIP